jgi:tRNA(Ile)-lysidine synthase
MALALLAHDWAKGRGGQAVALTVDHRLRRESGVEARQAGRWLKARGLSHHILPWVGDKPNQGIQAAAREARYGLLFDWCRHHGVLHLLLAHHQEDQAETFLLRLGRGSGIDGLAGMASLSEVSTLRLLRPLLDVPKTRLVATLRTCGQEWVEDSSNRDLAYARVRMRALMPDLACEGLSAAQLAATAGLMARARHSLREDVADLLSRAVDIYPQGYVWLNQTALATAETEVSLRALSRVLVCVGGRIYPPRSASLVRLHGELLSKKKSQAHTLHGCRLIPGKTKTGESSAAKATLVCREPAAAGECLALKPEMRTVWDGRFVFETGRAGKSLLSRVNNEANNGATKIKQTPILARLGRKGWSQIVGRMPELRHSMIPWPVRLSLPALWCGKKVGMVPHLEYIDETVIQPRFEVHLTGFCPANSLA